MAVTSTEGQRVPPQTGQGKTSRRKWAAEGEDTYCQRPVCETVQGDKAWGILQVCVGTESRRRRSLKRKLQLVWKPPCASILQATELVALLHLLGLWRSPACPSASLLTKGRLPCPWWSGGPAPPDLCTLHPRSHPTFTFTFRSAAFCTQGQFWQSAIWGLEASPGHTLEVIRIKQVIKPRLVTHAVFITCK